MSGDSRVDKWMSKNRSLVLRQTPIWAQGVALVVFGLGAVSITAASIFKIDEVVTVQGRLVPTQGSVEIKSPVSGQLTNVYVADGELVKKGQIIASFDTRKASTDINTYTTLLEIEKESLGKKKTIYKSRKSVLEGKLKTNKFILDNLKELVESGGFQQVQYLEKLDQVYELENQIKSLDLELQRMELEADKTISRITNSLNQAKLVLQYQTITATADGLVFDSSIRDGDVVREGELILNIVPQSKLKASVSVSNKDIGFVKVDQKAKIRIDAFPFSTFGEINGKVESIGADVIREEKGVAKYIFPVSISLEKNYLESNEVRIQLKSGMSLQANLRLRDKPVISLLSDLLVDKTESIKSIRQ
tara:strand:- start:227 stop:1312 length:1086 start_codon:yes stop_codon:yes gene_type:complete